MILLRNLALLELNKIFLATDLADFKTRTVFHLQKTWQSAHNKIQEVQTQQKENYDLWVNAEKHQF